MSVQTLDDQLKQLQSRVSSPTPSEPGTLEELMRDAETWTDECAQAHIAYMPRELLEYIFSTMKAGPGIIKELTDGSAVVVEYLPVEKQARVRSGVDAGLLVLQAIPGFSRTLVRAKGDRGLWNVERVTLRDVLRGTLSR